jgi:hypothetical protein
MRFRRLHSTGNQFICLPCLASPDTLAYFDIYPQLKEHWTDHHGVTDLRKGTSHW